MSHKPMLMFQINITAHMGAVHVLFVNDEGAELRELVRRLICINESDNESINESDE